MKNQIVRYLKENVLYREMETDEITYSLEEGRYEGIYSDRMIFSGLSETENSIRFDLTTVTKEKIYLLDGNGDRERTTKDFTGTSVFRYELACRKSTGEMTGYMRGISSTVKDHTMEAVVYGVHHVRMEEGQLKWDEKQLFYRDAPAGEDKYRPVAFDSSVRFYLEKEKLVFEYLTTYFDVDPVTMEKILSKDKYPAYVTKEK